MYHISPYSLIIIDFETAVTLKQFEYLGQWWEKLKY